jgi:hypothetical protein
LALLTNLVNPSFSQDQCRCEDDGTFITFTKVLCAYSGVHEGSFYNNPYAIVIDIVYRKIVCNGVTTISVNSFTIHSPLWNFRDWGFTKPGNDFKNCIDICPIDADGWPLDLNPSTQALWEDWMQRMVAKYIPFPINTGGNEILVESGCKSLVMVDWPDDATYIIMPGDGGGAPITVPMENSIMWANCLGKVCCHMAVRHGINGIVFQYLGLMPPGQSCGDIDPNFVPTYNNVVGTIISQTPCKPLCESNIVASFTTDLTDVGKDAALEFSITPTLFNDFIRINTTTAINKIEIYNINGQKVVEDLNGSKEIKTSQLKNGTYIMRVYFENNRLSTVKLYKND